MMAGLTRGSTLLDGKKVIAIFGAHFNVDEDRNGQIRIWMRFVSIKSSRLISFSYFWLFPISGRSVFFSLLG